MLTLTSVPVDHELFTAARFHDAMWMHHRVMGLFGDLGSSSAARSEGAVLFRYEPWVGEGRVLVQSAADPVVEGVRSTALTPVLEQLTKGARVRFLLHANAVRTVNRTGEDGKTRTHRADVPEEQREQWLLDRTVSFFTDVAVQDPEVSSSRLGRKAKLLTVSFTGTATVTDPQALAETVRAGVGRGKAYGCGLLTVAPLP